MTQVDSIQVEYSEDYGERIIELESQSNGKKSLVLLSLFPKPQYAMYYLGLFICVGGFVYGLNVSLISGALLFLKTDMKLDTPQESLISSGMSLGGIGGALLAIPFNEYLEASSHSYGELVSGRVVLGMGVALGTMTIPIYASECFPKSRRGLRGMDRDEEREEFFMMEKVCHSEKEASQDRWILFDLYRIPYCRKACIHGILFMFFQQFSGTNSILYFLGSMYRKAGLSVHDSIYVSMIGGGTLFLSSIPAIYMVDRYGRRPLLLILTPGVLVGLIIIGCAFFSCCTDSLVAIYTVGVVFYYIFWGSSLGPIPFVMNAELYPNYLRSYGMSLGILSNFIGNWITSYAFLEMTQAMTKPGTFIGFYGGITAIGWFYFLLWVPETKNLSLEEIKDILDRPWKDILIHNINQRMGFHRKNNN
ncbi:Putative metabolite transport protein YwtG [Galdieria sulphuraria]|nr:Putative metabolite transport protein YwtG [Galdieria sulphuraria]